MEQEIELKVIFSGRATETFKENLERLENQFALEANTNPQIKQKLDFVEAIKTQVNSDGKIQFNTKQLGEEDQEDFTDQIFCDIFGYYP